MPDIRTTANHSLRQRALWTTMKALRTLSLHSPAMAHALDDKGGESRGYVVYRGYRLPPKSLRGRMCGDAFRTDGFYFRSAVFEASKFSARFRYTKDARVVDIGSGLGRLATGMLAEVGEIQYLGIDANQEFVRWCKEHIESEHPTYRFVHLDMANALYNPTGAFDGSSLRLPVEDASADVVNLWGVFTNMVPTDVESFIREIGRILRPQGRCFLTAFAEDGVPDVTINPGNYVPYACNEPLTCVRYSKQWLFSTFRKYGLEVDEFLYHGSMFPKQSEIYVVKADAPGAPAAS